MSASEPVTQVNVLYRIAKAPDLETHLCDVAFPEHGIRVLEMRDFVPSSGAYGKGYWVGYEMIHTLSGFLAEIDRRESS